MLERLESDFVVGWQNIEREDFVGASHGYTCDQPAVGTTNGAGARNVQMFVLSPGGVVLHALPGFWHPDDLEVELEFADAVHRLWRDKKRGLKAKRSMYERMQRTAVRTHPRAMVARSSWQGFDAAAERAKLADGPRDTFQRDADGNLTDRLKPINQLVHERMAARPFIPFTKFDTAAFADYGRSYYDNNARVEPGVSFGGTDAFKRSQQKQLEKQKAKLEAERKRKARKKAATSRPSK